MSKTSEGNENREITNPDEQGNSSSRQVSATSSFQQLMISRSSPLPSPEDLEGYKRIMPDFPERLLKQFEEDSATNRELQKAAQAATIELNKKSLDADIAFEKRSQWMAFILIAGFLAGTIILAYLDKDNAALATGITSAFFALGTIFSKNKPSKKQDDKNDSE